MPFDFGFNASTQSQVAKTSQIYRGFRENNVSEDDATWILTSAFIIFTMQSGRFSLITCNCFFFHLYSCLKVIHNIFIKTGTSF